MLFTKTSKDVQLICFLYLKDVNKNFIIEKSNVKLKFKKIDN